MIATQRHWRILIGTILALAAAAFLAPLVVPSPYLVENRILAERPALPRQLREVRPFVKGVDAYVADHFPIRPHLIGVLNRVRLLAGVSGSPRVIVGRDGWLFYNDDTLLGSSRGEPRQSREDIRIWLRNFAGRTEALQARGTPYLVVVPPLKDTLYPDKAPSWSPGPSADRDALFLPRLAREAAAGEVLYLHDAVAAAKARGRKVFSRHDTHWSGYGAYAGYAAMIGRLHEMGITDAPLPMEVFADEGPRRLDPPADMAKMLGVADFVDVDYPHVDNPRGWARAKKRYLTTSTDWTSPQVIDTGETGRPVLLLVRDSFSEELLPFLFPHFSRIVFVHGQDGMWRPDLVARFKPDVVVLEVLESGLRNAMQKGPEPSTALGTRIDGLARDLVLTPMLRAPDAKLAASFAKAKPVTDCNLERRGVEASPGWPGVLSISGWFASPQTPGASPHAWVRLQGHGRDLAAPFTVDGRRPDVAAHFKQPRAEVSGFQATLPVPDLPKGDYAVTLYRRTHLGLAACRVTGPLQAR